MITTTRATAVDDRDRPQKHRERGLGLIFTIFAAALPPVIVISVNLLPGVLVVAGLAAAVEFRRAHGRLPRLDLALAVPLALLLAWALASVAWTPVDARRAAILVFRLLPMFLATLVLGRIAAELSDETRPRVWRAYGWGMVAAVLMLLSERASGMALHAFFHRGSGETPLTVLDRTGSLMAIGVWPLVPILWRGRIGPAALLAPFLMIGLLSLLANATARLALGAGCIAALLAWPLPRLVRITTTAVVVILLAGAPFIMKVMFASGIQDGWPIFGNSLEHRFNIWNYVSDLVLQHPIRGWGFDMSRHFSETPWLAYQGPTRVAMALHPHDAALQVWAELGAVGALIVLALLVACLGRIARTEGPARIAMWGMFTTNFVIANISYGIWQSRWLGGFMALWCLVPLLPRGAASVSASSESPRRRPFLRAGPAS